MAIITLTSDWGNRDQYTASVKGRILSLVPDATIVDISHEVEHFNHNHAAFVLRNSYHCFPKGTVHIIGVNSIAGINTPHTVMKYHGHYFIGADNGILSLICSDSSYEIWELDIPSDTDYFTFPSRDTFPNAAAHILSGKPLSDLGTAGTELRTMMQFEPMVSGHQIRGKIIHFDHYQNAITNITETLFRSFIKGANFTISFKTYTDGINKISESYDDVPEGEIVALFSTSGYLQIAVNKGSGSNLLGLRFDDSVMIERN